MLSKSTIKKSQRQRLDFKSRAKLLLNDEKQGLIWIDLNLFLVSNYKMNIFGY